MANKITVDRGNTLIINYTNQDTAGDPISLVGATVYFTVKSVSYDSVTNDSSAVIKKNVTGFSGNTAQITCAAADTYIPPSTYFWDITVQYADGSVITPLSGEFIVNGIPTNRAS